MNEYTQIQNVLEKKGAKLLLNLSENKLNNLKLQCKCGRIWLTNFERLVKRNQWCPSCSRINSGVKKPTIEELKKIAVERGGKLLSKNYVHHRDKLQWECKFGHKWWTSSDVIKNGKKWCPACQTSYGENITREIFNKLFNKEFVKIKPDWLLNPKTNRNLELDGYNEELNIAFEYDGVQHFNKKKVFNKKYDFAYSLYRDKLKKELCEKKGVLLISIPYTIEHKNIKDYVITELKKNDVKVNSNITIDYNTIYVKNNNYARIESFKKKVTLLGYELVSEYNGYLKNVKLKCNKGHLFETTARSIDRNKGCPVCSGYRKKSTEDVIKILNDMGFLFMDEKYVPGSRFKTKCLKCNKILKIRNSDLNKHVCVCQKEVNVNGN